MDITLHKVGIESKCIIENLFPFYLYDMSEYMGWAANKDGTFRFKESLIASYWTEADHTPYIIKANGELAGFTMVRVYPGTENLQDIGQFFILRKFKRKGVGQAVLKLLLRKYPGDWQIRALVENSGAIKFWKRSIEALVGDNYSMKLAKDVDLEMLFFHFQSPFAQNK